MTTPAPDLAAVLARLDRLERLNDDLRRQLRRQRWWRAALLGLAVAVVGVSCQARPDPSASGTAAGPKVIVAEKFVLKDAQGRVHGMLTIGPDGPALLFLDPEKNGQPRLGLTGAKGAPALSMYDTAGTERLRVAVHNGFSGLMISNAKASPCFALGEGPKGPAMEMVNPDQSISARLQVGGDYGHVLLCYKEVPRVALSLAPDGAGFIAYDQQGKVVFFKP